MHFQNKTINCNGVRNCISRILFSKKQLNKNPMPMSFFSLAEQKHKPADKLVRQRLADVSHIERVETFDNPGALHINQARLNHLESLQLLIDSKTVLDVGCGVGHLAQFFVHKGCEVFCIDGREENIADLQRRYPRLKGAVVDVQRNELHDYGMFDIVFCYGLLYHLENPLAALQNMATVCKELLLLETCITDYPHPLLHLVEETATYSQSLTGIGCRPTPSYVIMALLHIGFDYVYIPTTVPLHPDFQFSWKCNLQHVRNGHNIRQIFIASRSSLDNTKLMLVGQCV